VSHEKIGSNINQLPFRSGESVPISGLWRPEHDRCSTAPELWISKLDHFPPCPTCGAPAKFTLLEEVKHISEDSDFL
jgi:hypothetical protein